MKSLEYKIRGKGCITWVGNDFDSWDLEVRGGLLGAARIKLAVEEHGGGKQLLRFRVWPKIKTSLLFSVGILATLAILAGADGASATSAILGVTAIGVLVRGLYESEFPINAVARSISELDA